jgi:signal transduction histidine kinase
MLSSSVRLIGNLADGLPMTMGDANQLKQVFLNVIGNAVQSMPDGGTIEVTSEQSGQRIAITVSDNGPGITEEVMSKMFVPFFTTRKQGSGLGMAVTRSIVENHGGTIEVSSEVGKGTTVRIAIPLVRSTQEAEHRARYGERGVEAAEVSNTEKGTGGSE